MSGFENNYAQPEAEGCHAGCGCGGNSSRTNSVCTNLRAYETRSESAEMSGYNVNSRQGNLGLEERK